MKKYIINLRYILKHKWFVFWECFNHGIIWRGIFHDLSKFLPSEFFAYADYFFGSGSNIESFSKAWLKHQHRNPHHWQYWVESSQKVHEMPMVFRVEMLCDWIGAGKAQGKDDVVSFWDKNNYSMDLGEETRKWLFTEINKLRVDN